MTAVTTATALKRVEIKPRYGNFIAGQFRPPVREQYFSNPSPVTGSQLCEIPRSTAEDVELALDAAHAAAPGWGKTSATERANLLNKVADRLEANLEKLATLETLDNGKPIRESTAADLPLAVDHFRYFAGAIRAQAALAAGDVASAVRWAEAQPAPVEQELLSGGWPGALVVAVAYDYEHVRIAPAQVWLAAGEHDRALAALDVQARVADAFHLGWLRTKVLALRALAYAGSGDPDAALRCLEAALDLAAPEGHVRLFAAEGAPMAGLLTRVRQRRAGVADAYLDDLIQACAPAHPDAGPLSGRELDVLRLIAAGCDNPEIGRRLFVAPSTVKTHVNRIFGKLGVVSRTQAVARARELELL